MGVPKGCENQIGPRVKRLSHAMNRRFMEFAREDGLDEVTAISGRIMGLIYFNSDRDIFPKDVEQAFKITRSSVTSVVQLMEKNGYISRQPVPYDARLKKLVLTDKGMEAHEAAAGHAPGGGHGVLGPHGGSKSTISSLCATK
jgi:DNA-binding MarR family transcriptional regulator